MTDLTRSLHFYRDQIGLTINTDTSTPDTAILTTFQGHRFLIAGPEAPAWSDLLVAEHTVLKPGEKIFMWDPEFDQRLRRLEARGIDFTLIERPWGDRIIEAEGPDGYGVTLSAIVNRTPDDVLALCRRARTELRQLTMDLSADELSTRPGPGEWSIREIVHHLVDSNLTVLHAIRVALAEPGKHYHGNPYDQNLYATELRYQERRVEPALAFFESTIDFIESLTSAVPDSWNRSVTTASGETNVKTYIEMMAVHALEHLEQIRAIRSAIRR